MTWRWTNFSAAELKSGDGAPFPLTQKSMAFLDKLQRLREALAFPFPITSAYRTPDYNARVGGAQHSAHLEARAVDIAVYGERAFEIVSAARGFGFTGIGVHQKGGSRFIHLDDMDGPSRPTIWSY